MSNPETEIKVEETKPSKWDRIKTNASMAGFILIPIALTGGSMYVAIKTSKINFETAKLNLETAKLNKS